MTVIKNEAWIEALNQTEYEPIETDENVYQSYRFSELDIDNEEDFKLAEVVAKHLLLRTQEDPEYYEA